MAMKKVSWWLMTCGIMYIGVGSGMVVTVMQQEWLSGAGLLGNLKLYAIIYVLIAFGFGYLIFKE